jgi:hypothetical protein
MERLRRGAEGGAEGPGAASGLGPTQNEATDLPAELAFTTIKAGRWSDPLFGVARSAGPRSALGRSRTKQICAKNVGSILQADQGWGGASWERWRGSLWRPLIGTRRLSD